MTPPPTNWVQVCPASTGCLQVSCFGKIMSTSSKMSCQIRSKASISELNRVKRILFPDEDIEDDDKWNDVDAWSWKTDFEDTAEQTSKMSTDWLQTCLTSMSPQSQILVITNMDRYVVLVAKWEKCNDQEVQKYQLVSPPTATNGLGDEITSVLCVPIKSLQKSSQGMPDWICIVLGFSSGAIHMYTTEGNLLMTQNFHDEPVQQLKFDSHSSDCARELCILYSKIAVTVDVLGLFNALRACRSYLAKGRAFQGSSTDLTLNPPPLHYKKFSLQDQQKTNDCHALGTVAPNQFDHLVTASIAGGFHARYSNAPPVSTGILSLGSQPYCAWHYAVEGSATPLLTEVAYALASKVTSKIFSKASGWLGWGSSKSESGLTAKGGKENRTEPATPVYPKFGLADALREALTVVLSPNEKLAAVTDSLGRITLVDIYKGIAVRVWKGYREAQCGWVASWEDVDASAARADEESATARTASFLVIYIAKRGLLEVWTAQQGTRVAAFNCSKNAKLLYVGISSCDRDLSQCRLLSPDGTIADVVVPFHCALKGDSSQKARDLHILQQLRAELNRNDSTPDLNLLMEIRHAGVVSQGLDLLLESRALNAEAFADCLTSLVDHYVQAEALDAESRLLLSRSRLLSQLLNVYVHLKTVRSRPPDYDTATNAASMTDEDVAGALHISVDEMLRVIPNRSNHAIHPPSDAVLTVTDPAMHEFLQSFELCCGHGSVDCIRLKSSLNRADHVRLSRWIFAVSFSRHVDELDDLSSVLKNSLIVPDDLALLLITYWLSLEPPAPVPSLVHFHKLLAFICNLAGLEDVVISDRPSSWWQKIGEILSKSTNLEQASCAAFVCKSVTMQFERKRLFKIPEKKNESVVEQVKMDDSMSDWEDMSVDMVQWNVLLKQLEDLSSLSRLIRYQPSQLRRLNASQLDYYIDQIPEDPLDFTLSGILQKGRGSVTELIARWLTQNLLEADTLFPDRCSSSADDPSQDDSMSEAPTEWAPEADKISLGSSEEIAVVQELFQDVRQHLPHSTERDVVLLNVSLEYAAMWIKSPKLMPLLDHSLATVMTLRSNLLRHGMCRMLWSMSLCPIFHDLALLMDKTGRLPKSFTSRKINLPSPDLVIPFLQATIKLLDASITAAMSFELEAPPFIRYDDIWATCEGATPILEVAVRQRLINIDLVLLHLQLAQVLLFMANLEIKGVHPLSLFDQHAARLAFFQDLHTHPPLPSQFIEPIVASTRLHFLKQVIGKAVELMEQDQNQTLDYVNQAVKLGYEWHCDVDELRIKYVHLLYLNGKDHLAHEVLPSIDANDKLTPVLLSVVGGRVKHLLPAVENHAASLSPMTVAWLNNVCLDAPSPSADPSPQDTHNLLIETLSRLSTESSDQFIANELMSMMRSMMDISK